MNVRERENRNNFENYELRTTRRLWILWKIENFARNWTNLELKSRRCRTVCRRKTYLSHFWKSTAFFEMNENNLKKLKREFFKFIIKLTEVIPREEMTTWDKEEVKARMNKNKVYRWENWLKRETNIFTEEKEET